MPARASTQARGLMLSLGALVLISTSLAGGWWWGRNSRNEGNDRSRAAIEQQANRLRQRLADGTAQKTEQQRLVQLLLVLGETEEARTLLEQLADQQPQRWQLRLLLAELHRNTNNRTAAARELRQLLNLRPDRIEALQLLTLLQLEQGRGSQAQALLQQRLALGRKPALQPQVLPIGLLLADLQQRMGQRPEAIATYKQLAKEFPADPRPLLGLALLHQEQGNTKAAQEALAEARSRQPGSQDERLDRVAASWGIAAVRNQVPPKGAARPDL
jgi:tetratricopeptide (TPR) repeat protein